MATPIWQIWVDDKCLLLHLSFAVHEYVKSLDDADELIDRLAGEGDDSVVR